jgi:hypothetical protein
VVRAMRKHEVSDQALADFAYCCCRVSLSTLSPRSVDLIDCHETTYSATEKPIRNDF